MGRLVTEAELARKYGVSRTPVLQALRMLEHQGLVPFGSTTEAGQRRIKELQ